MLKKSIFSPARLRRAKMHLFPRFVLVSHKPSTLRRDFSESGNTVGGLPFAKIHSRGERPTRSAVCTSSALRSLRPCWTNFLSILRDRVLLSRTGGLLDFQRAGIVSLPPLGSTNRQGAERGSRWVLFLFCSVLVLGFSGCTSVTPPKEVQLRQATVEELTALLSQREAAIQTMKGLFSAKVRGGIIPIASRMEGALYYRRPNTIRLRGFTAVGSELFEFVQVDGQFRLRLPTMGRVMSGSPSDMSEMGKLARPFQLSVWAMGGVLGTGTIEKDETVALVEEGDRYRLDVFGHTPGGEQVMRRRLWFERQTFLVVREDRLMESGAVEATIQYEDFRAIGEAGATSNPDGRMLRPFKILLEDGKGQGSVQVTFHEMTPNIPLSATDLGQV
jgi:outer membrane lipoprotein-sorting protein